MKTKLKTALYRWTLRRLRLLLDAADEWLYAEEHKVRSVRASVPAADSSVDRQASAAREKAIRKTRPARPRLRYERGQFVRVQ